VRTFGSALRPFFRPTPKRGRMPRKRRPTAPASPADLGSHLAIQALVLFRVLPTPVMGPIVPPRTRRHHTSMTPSTCGLYYARNHGPWRASTSLAAALPRCALFGSKHQRQLPQGQNLDPQKMPLPWPANPFQSKPWGTGPGERPGAPNHHSKTRTGPTPAHHRIGPTLPRSYPRFYANVADTLLGKAEQAVTLLDAPCARLLAPCLKWGAESSENAPPSPGDCSGGAAL